MRTITTTPLPSFGFPRRLAASSAAPTGDEAAKATIYVFWSTDGENIRLWTQDKARADSFQAETGLECFTYHDAPIPGPDGTPGNGQWAKFMSLCKKRGWSPAEMSDLFVLAKEAGRAAAPTRASAPIASARLATGPDAVESIVLEGGKYTVELGARGDGFHFAALRYGEPWRDMSSDGDGLMLAMFQELRAQQQRIEQLEQAAKEPLQKTMQRWDVEDGSVPPEEAEPTYVLKMDARRGLIDVRPEGVSDEQLPEAPHLFIAVEINKGVPCLFVFKDALSGEVEAQYYAMPGGQLVTELYAKPDVQAIGEQIRSLRSRASEAATESNQAPRA